MIIRYRVGVPSRRHIPSEGLDEAVLLAVAAYGTALGLLSAGAFDLAANTLSAAELPMTSTEDMQLSGSLVLASSLVSTARNDGADQSAALEHAAELGERTGETNMLGFGFGPSNVAVWRMQGALEAGEHAQAAAIAETVAPEALPVRARQAVYWREHGRALAHLPKRRVSTVTMLRQAEAISPEHVQRHPFTRSTLAELVTKARRDAMGRELRGMAYPHRPASVRQTSWFAAVASRKPAAAPRSTHERITAHRTTLVADRYVHLAGADGCGLCGADVMWAEAGHPATQRPRCRECDRVRRQ